MYSALARYYDEIFPLLPAGIDFIAERLSPDPFHGEQVPCCSGPGAFPALSDYRRDPVNILDAGCATGSISLALAGKGFHVDGIDSDAEMIKASEQRAEDRDLTCLTHFVKDDILNIRSVFGDKKYKSVICMGNTLPHITDPSDRAGFFRQIRKLLAKDGLCILQLLNYDKILDKKPEQLPVIETDSIIFSRIYSYAGKNHVIRFSTSLIIKESGERIENAVSLMPVKSADLMRSLKKYGFGKTGFFGSFAEEPFDPETSDMLLCTAARQ